MNTFETAAIISLVDHLSAPLAQMSNKVAGHESGLARMGAKMAEHGRNMTMHVTVPIVAGLKEMADKALEFSRIENTMRGVLEQRARSVDNLTMSTKAYAAAQMEAAKAAAQDAYNGVGGLPKGLANVKEYQESVLSAVKAGYQDTTTNDPARSMVPAEALSNQAAVLAVANRVDAHTATDDLISLSNALQVETRDKSGHALGMEELNRKFGHIADVLSTMYTSSNFADHHEVVQSLKMAAPLARFANLDLGQIAMMSATQKEAGFRGDESSIAQRSMIGSFIAPKTSAYGGFASLGLNLRDYQTMRAGMNPDDFLKQAHMHGYKGLDAAVKKAWIDFQSDDINKGHNLDVLGGAWREAIMATGKAKNPIKPDVAQKFVDKFMDTLVGSVDVPRIIEDIRKTGKMTPEIWSMIGEKRQGPRVLPILTPPKDLSARDEFVNEGQRQYGPNWEMMMGMKGPIAPGPTPSQYVEEQAGIAARQAAEHAKGLEGAYKQINNAFELVIMKMSDQHVFDDIANDIVKVIDWFARLDPVTIRLGTDAAIAVAALGPLIWGLGTLGTAAAGAAAILGRMTGMGGAAVAAERAVGGAAQALRVTGTAAREAGRAIEAGAEATRAAARQTVAGVEAEIGRGIGSGVKAAILQAEQASARVVAMAADQAAARRAAGEALAASMQAGEENMLRIVEHGLAERAALEARAAADGAQAFATRSAAFVRGLDNAAVEAMSKLAEVGADAAKAASKFDVLSGAADRAAATAAEKYGRLAALVDEHASQALARSGSAIEEAIGQAEKRMLAQGNLLEKLVAPNSTIERSLGVAQRAAEAAAQAATSAAEAANKVLATQAAKGAAEDAAAQAANRLANAINAAAKAAEDAAAKTGAAKAAETAADVAGKAATEAGAKAASKAAETAAEAASKGGTLAGRTAEEAALNSSKFAAERAAAEAAQAISKAKLLGMVARGLGLVSGVGDVAFAAQSVIDIGTARRDRENDVEGQIRRRYDADAALKRRMDFSTFYDREYPKIGFNPYRTGMPESVWEQGRRAADEFHRDPEGTRGRNAAINENLTHAAQAPAPAAPAQPQKVDVGVQGTVSGSAEVHNTTSITVEPSAYFVGLVKTVEHLATLNLTGKMGETMSGSNGAKPSMPSPAPAAIGHM